MDPRLLRYYNSELQHLREVGAEFAQEYPKVAGRLGVDGTECADPYVERLLEGFAFMAARVQLKIDAEFPRFTSHMLEAVMPHYLAPTPSMAVVHIAPDLSEGGLAEGFEIERDSVLRSQLGPDDKTACEYRTGHKLTLWPLEIAEAEYLPTAASIGNLGLPVLPRARAAIRLKLRTTAGLNFAKLALDTLSLYIRGSDQQPMHIYEQLLAHAVGVVVRPAERPSPWHQVVPAENVRRVGFDDDQALLPYGPRSFHGYRLIHEYFAFASRYMFVDIVGLGSAVRRCEGNELEVVVELDRSEGTLEHALDADNFSLFCTTAVNLFPKRADRIHINEQFSEHHVVVDRTRPLDYEVYQVNGLSGFGAGSQSEHVFLPFYACTDLSTRRGGMDSYFTVRREPRVLSERQRRVGTRTSYVGSEMFLSLVDKNEAPYSTDLRQLAPVTLCTNRDLPLTMPVGKGSTDFSMESAAPWQSVRCVAGPTPPRASWVHGETAWRLINHLSLNYLSITDRDENHGAEALRELLSLYTETNDRIMRRQIESVRSVQSRAVTRRMPVPGPIVFGRGMEITVTCDESGFEGTGAYLLGAVLEEFFSKYVSLNSFTQTVLRSTQRGEIKRWRVRSGRRQTL